MLVTNDTVNIVDTHTQQLKELERIEKLPRIQQWQAIRDFVLKTHPGFIPAELDFIAAVRELREIDNLKKTGASKSGAMRHAMKIPQYIYTALTAYDLELLRDMSGKNPEAQARILKQLYKAFPMYRVARVL